jgi:hypothetical protein
MKQVVLQFTAWELQVIMQLVVVEVRGVESPGVGATTLGVVVCAKAAPHAAVAATASPPFPKFESYQAASASL